MRLTHAQCLGLWALASEHGRGTVFEIETEPDNYGHIIIVARSEDDSPYHPKERRFKLFSHGGHEALEEPAPKPSTPEAGLSQS